MRLTTCDRCNAELGLSRETPIIQFKKIVPSSDGSPFGHDEILWKGDLCQPCIESVTRFITENPRKEDQP